MLRIAAGRRAPLTAVLLLALWPAGINRAAGPPVPSWQVVAPHRAQPLFHVATGIAVDRNRNVYVSDSAEGRVKIFSPRGTLLAVWGTNAPGPLHWYPTGIAVDRAGNVSVLADGITMLDSHRHVLRHLAAPGAQAIAVGGSGNLFVLSTAPVPGQLGKAGWIQKFSPAGALLATWHTPTQQGDIVEANGLAIDPRGNVSVTLATHNAPRAGPLTVAALYTLSPAGKLLRTISATRVPLGAVQAADGQGNTYLVGLYPERYGIEKLSPAGRVLGRWDGSRSDPFGEDLHLTLDGRGRLYVADTRNLNLSGPAGVTSYIHILTTAGRELARWGRPMPRPSFPLGLGLAVGPHGTIYAGARIGSGHAFLVISPDGRSLRPLGTTGPVFVSASALALDYRGHLFVRDGVGGRVNEFLTNGRLLRQWAPASTTASSTDGLALAPDGTIYLISNSQILTFDQTGRLLGRIGSAGSGPGQFSGPRALTIDTAGNIYVADTGNNRVQKLSPAGAYLASYGGPALLDRPISVVVDVTGNVFVLDTTHDTVFAFNQTGTLLGTFGAPGVLTGQLSEPTDLALDRQGNVYVLDYGNNRIQKLLMAGYAYQ